MFSPRQLQEGSGGAGGYEPVAHLSLKPDEHTMGRMRFSHSWPHACSRVASARLTVAGMADIGTAASSPDTSAMIAVTIFRRDLDGNASATSAVIMAAASSHAQPSVAAMRNASAILVLGGITAFIPNARRSAATTHAIHSPARIR